MNLIIIQATDEEMASMTLAEIVAKSAAAPVAAAAPVVRLEPYTMKEACEVLKLSANTVRNLIEAGRLKRVPGLRHVRITAESMRKELGGAG